VRWELNGNVELRNRRGIRDPTSNVPSDGDESKANAKVDVPNAEFPPNEPCWIRDQPRAVLQYV
jgi:hypothetical protein